MTWVHRTSQLYPSTPSGVFGLFGALQLIGQGKRGSDAFHACLLREHSAQLAACLRRVSSYLPMFPVSSRHLYH